MGTSDTFCWSCFSCDHSEPTPGSLKGRDVEHGLNTQQTYQQAHNEAEDHTSTRLQTPIPAHDLDRPLPDAAEEYNPLRPAFNRRCVHVPQCALVDVPLRFQDSLSKHAVPPINNSSTESTATCFGTLLLIGRSSPRLVLVSTSLRRGHAMPTNHYCCCRNHDKTKPALPHVVSAIGG